MFERIVAVGAAIFIAFGLTSPAVAAPGQAPPTTEDAAPPQPVLDPAAPFDAAARHVIVGEIAKAMRDDYVEPAVGARAAAAIEQASGSSAYDPLDTRGAFAERLTADLAAVAHDKHLNVIAAGATRPGPAPQLPPLNEGGVVRADRLAGDIGYIEVIGFPPPEGLKGPLDRAMAALADTRALIVDMRRNGGGHPMGVAYLVSFFVDARTPVHIMDIQWRKPETAAYSTNQDFTSPTPTAYLGKPVYVLTSSDTFSGGEEFCYDMQALKRAVLVGETTGGALANPGGVRQLGAGLLMFLPMGKARSPITGANWEGVGVKPDIAAPAGQALEVALEKLGGKPMSEDIAALSQASLFQVRSAPLPGTEAALRRLIETTARGQPEYDRYSPVLAQATHNQIGVIQPMLAAMGPIQSVTFRGPGMFGGDSFEVKFAKGAGMWSIRLAPDGTVDSASFGPAPAAPVTTAPPARPEVAPKT